MLDSCCRRSALLGALEVYRNASSEASQAYIRRIGGLSANSPASREVVLPDPNELVQRWRSESNEVQWTVTLRVSKDDQTIIADPRVGIYTLFGMQSGGGFIQTEAKCAEVTCCKSEVSVSSVPIPALGLNSLRGRALKKTFLRSIATLDARGGKLWYASDRSAKQGLQMSSDVNTELPLPPRLPSVRASNTPPIIPPMAG